MSVSKCDFHLDRPGVKCVNPASCFIIGLMRINNHINNQCVSMDWSLCILII